jgi:large subunit ribosomal protein L18
MINVAKRRRREGKTNYTRRIKLLSGEKARVVIRKTNKYIYAQYITSYEAKDKVIMHVSSKELLNYGWPKEKEMSLKSIPAAYLTGQLFGKRLSKEKHEKDFIIDLGMMANIHKSRIYAFMKGLKDSGATFTSKKEKTIFPSEERLMGRHMKPSFESVVKKIQELINQKQ